jgi:copper chaperone
MLTLKVPDMTCGHCAQSVEKAVKSVDPLAKVQIDLTRKMVTVETAAQAQAISESVRYAGYDNQAIAGP